MECQIMSSAKQIFLTRHVWLLWPTRKLNFENILSRQYSMAAWNSRMGSQRLSYSNQATSGKHSMCHTSWRTFCTPFTLEEKFSSKQSDDDSNDDVYPPEAPSMDVLEQPLNIDELKSLLADPERTKLINKLSEANQQNRFLKRQLLVKEDTLINFKSELAVMELEIQAFVALAEEIAKSGIPQGSRKINGKYIQSHLLSRLQAVHEKLKEQIKDVDAARSKEVPLYWCGMAESVQVMGSFDGWSQGEHLSPEYTGYNTRFSTTLLLRRGRYEIKFLVDGEWHLSAEFPLVGEGLMENNLLIVE